MPATAAGWPRRAARWWATPGERRTQSGERYFELEELYVCPDFRGRGVGQLLLACVEEDARREGLAKLMLNAANRNHAPLLRFYLREGMTPHSFRMFKRL